MDDDKDTIRIVNDQRPDEEAEPPPQDSDNVGGPDDEDYSRHHRPQFDRSMSTANAPTFWQWLKSIFTASDDYIYENCGDDALQYLR